MGSSILVVEDEPQIRRLIEVLLDSEGFTVVACENGQRALEVVDETQPDLVLLDLMMPEMDGIMFAEKLRARPAFRTTPILVVTARDQQVDKYEAFKVGANAYLTKPFDPLELLFNVRSLLSLTQKEKQPLNLAANGVELDQARYRVRVGEREVQLTKMETAVLAQLMKQPGRVFSADELSESIHQTYRSVDAIHAHIKHLRSKLEHDPKNPAFIITLGRKGYYFAAE